MNIARRTYCIAAMALVGLGAAAHSWAQEWPARQAIRIVVPYPVGGNADSGARAVADVISRELKQSVIIDNRPGASSIIGTDAIAKSPPDGYTIGVVSDSHAINQVMAALPKSSEILGARVPYDAVNDFVPLAGMIQVPLVLVVNPKVEARSVKELVALSGKGSGVNFGTMGNGSPWFIHMHQLNALTKGTFVDVPYRGLAPAATDILAGQIEAMVIPVHFAMQYIKAGKLIALANMGAQRHPLLPDVPTLAEAGYPGLVASNYLYFVAPAGTPKAIADRLSREIIAAVRLPAMKEKMISSGDPYPAEPAELMARLKRDIDTYGAAIRSIVK